MSCQSKMTSIRPDHIINSWMRRTSVWFQHAGWPQGELHSLHSCQSESKQSSGLGPGPVQRCKVCAGHHLCDHCLIQHLVLSCHPKAGNPRLLLQGRVSFMSPMQGWPGEFWKVTKLQEIPDSKTQHGRTLSCVLLGDCPWTLWIHEQLDKPHKIPSIKWRCVVAVFSGGWERHVWTDHSVCRSQTKRTTPYCVFTPNFSSVWSTSYNYATCFIACIQVNAEVVKVVRCLDS